MEKRIQQPQKRKWDRKSLFTLILTLVLTVCMIPTVKPVRVQAAPFDELDIPGKITAIWNTLVNDKADKTDVLNVKKEIMEVLADKAKEGVEDYFDEQTGETVSDALTAQASLDSQASAAENISNLLWGSIIVAFKGGDALGFNLDTKDFVNNPDRGGKNLVNVFQIFGYSLVLLFFAMSLIDQTIKYEIFTLRGAVNIFGRLILAKVIIDSSCWVCTTIISVTQDLCASVLKITGDTVIITNMPHITVETSSLPLIGPLVDFWIAALISTPVNIIAFITMFCGCAIVIKLLLRSFELTLLTVISPAFFACAASQPTMQYFKNFLGTFLQAVFSIVFMAIVYFVGVEHITYQAADITTFAELGTWLAKVLPNTVIVIAMSIMMVKPPRVLTGLIK